MKRFASHLLGVAQGAEIMFSDFEHDGPMWSAEGPREARVAVTFGEAFSTAPVVHVSMGMWDTEGQTNQRADLRAENITPQGFDMVFRTWGDSRIARVRADWMAIGPLPDDDIWDVD
ncbi:ATP synthase protein I [Roseibacterium elongatum DSM 19469]|uniref:ATP synthase protein I n=2 Tax=Roseicyclus elongatus TaxID=159346 RepID=W8S635_9RHOB|nr:H-type lectin domain-containing protein [Roseibacterium elongatum]AHM04311.1 ATP synthase protein I [Roseibacterium elongatum DSM 19469]